MSHPVELEAEVIPMGPPTVVGTLQAERDKVEKQIQDARGEIAFRETSLGAMRKGLQELIDYRLELDRTLMRMAEQPA